jgi:fatty-acyl-CoA synthase
MAAETQTYAGLVVDTLRDAGDRPVLVGEDRSWSGQDALAQVWRLAAALRDCTGESQPTVSILSYNRPQSWLAQVATMASGGRFCWLHPRASVADHLAVLDDSAPKLLLIDASFAASVALPLAERFRAAGGLVACLGGAGPGPDLLVLADAQAKCSETLSCRPDDIGLLCYTGGTTGGPKAVARTHRQWATVARMIAADFEIGQGCRFLAASPLSHVGGTMVLPVLIGGGCVRMLSAPGAEAIAQALLDWQAHATLVVPTALDALVSIVRDRALSLPALRRVYFGGAASTPARLRTAHEVLGPVLFQVYGQAEGFPICVLPPSALDPSLESRWRCCGRPAGDTDIRIGTAEGGDGVPGEVGELLARGPQVMTGYWRLEEASRHALKDGWLHTGDLARLHEDGFVELVGRVRDMIITGGFNVYARDVESALEAHPAVEAAAVFGTPDARWGEAVTACVVLRTGCLATESQLREWVRQRKGDYQAPKSIDFVPVLPLTSVGKIDKRSLIAHASPTRSKGDGV